MKYFEPGDILLSDFDGVYIDSQARFQMVMQQETDAMLWMKYLTSICWREFLRDCKEMPYATEVFLELQRLGILKGFITKIHSFEEGQEKTIYVREKGIYVPMYFVLPAQLKSDIYKPNRKTIILEDKEENAVDWEFHGGKAIIYDPSTEEKSKRKIKSLDSLLK